MKEYDAVVIGAGPGGYVCAIRLAQLGAKTAVVEKRKLGGVCLNEGCIPSKSLIHVSHIIKNIKKSDTYGLKVSFDGIDMKKIQSWKNSVINKLSKGIEFLFKHNKVDLYRGEARFKGRDIIQIDGADELKAKNIVIATGGRAMDLPIFRFDSKIFFSPQEILSSDDLPKHLIVIGGGVAGLELGSCFHNFEIKVTVIEIMPQILPGMDKEIAQSLTRLLKKRGIDVYVDAKSEKVESISNGVRIYFSYKGETKTVEGDKVLVAVGTKPESENLNLNAADVKVNAKGFVEVDDKLRTSVENIYAIGDVIGPPYLAHKASYQGVAVAEIIAGKRENVGLDVIPSAVFTEPELAFAGLDEETAKAKGYDVKVSRFPYAALGRAVASDETDGFVKIVSDMSSQKILGCQIIGAQASNIICEIALAINKGLELSDISELCHPHPTFPEAILESAEVALNKAIHIAK